MLVDSTANIAESSDHYNPTLFGTRTPPAKRRKLNGAEQADQATTNSSIGLLATSGSSVPKK